MPFCQQMPNKCASDQAIGPGYQNGGMSGEFQKCTCLVKLIFAKVNTLTAKIPWLLKILRRSLKSVPKCHEIF